MRQTQIRLWGTPEEVEGAVQRLAAASLLCRAAEPAGGRKPGSDVWRYVTLDLPVPPERSLALPPSVDARLSESRNGRVSDFHTS